MQIPVLIQPVPGGGFRAKSAEPLPLDAPGATREEALANLGALLNGRLVNGTELVGLDVPSKENPWLAMAGMHDPNDPEVQAWKLAMEEYRQQVEDDPDYL